MVFSSPVFLFLFLPLTLAAYALLRSVFWRNIFLVAVSLFFYAWGEKIYVLIMIASTAINYILGRVLNHYQDCERPSAAKWTVAVAVVVNIGLLGFFKYQDFLAVNINYLAAFFTAKRVPELHLHLPIGISFFTFHALSYIMDVYRKNTRAAKNFSETALYISFFPQLIAGPIVRYKEIAAQISNRTRTLADMASGAERFIIGLGKKMILANTFGETADIIFGIPSGQLTQGLALLGIALYTLQIYFDFSGYSDMAIGLAKMFGFTFPENFNYPYVSLSIKEFWRRWHITLSNWFRDYLYIPMGGNRGSAGRMYFNLFTVFFLCGLWHGASWNFVVWGMIHGLALVLERLGAEKMMEKWPRVLRHIYTLSVVAVAWAFFRSDSLDHAVKFISAMAGYASGDGGEYNAGLYMDRKLIWLMAVGLIAATPVWPNFIRFWGGVKNRWDGIYGALAEAVSSLANVGWLAAVLAVSLMLVARSSYNPFIYFRF
ncbi:MAG: MBOAT family protein [Nitrospinae bacterium]|nr:MBOAT family protein [Nitrospinota bacterium]